MRKRLRLFVAALFFTSAFILFGCSDDNDTEYNSVNGWNLGNTLDACTYDTKANLGLSTERKWGMPVTTESMIKAVAARGFKTIRIPVSWHNHITEGTNYTIDPAWLSRVKTIVDWSLGSGMKVIINIHHDNLTSSQLSNAYGYTVNTSQTEQATSKKYIVSIWNQVAGYFKAYDDRLIFELLNEPRNRDSANDGFSIPSNVSSLNGVIASYEKAALDVIRATGEKNVSRYVMVAPYAASPDGTAGWSLPSDSVAGKLIVSVHAYTPYEFCMGSANVNVFSESHMRSIDRLFDNLDSKYISKEIPVIIGETSATDKNNLDERKRWTTYFYGKAKNMHVPVVLWDNMNTVATGGDINSGECHGYFNRNTLQWFFPTLVDEMVK